VNITDLPKNPFDVSFDDLLAMALVKLGVAAVDQTLTRVDALNRLDEFAQQQLADGGNVAFIVYEAQNLNRRAMENLRLLSSLENPSTNWFKSFYPGSRNWRPSWTSLKFASSPSASAFGETSIP